jgi:hypothetical protein
MNWLTLVIVIIGVVMTTRADEGGYVSIENREDQNGLAEERKIREIDSAKMSNLIDPIEAGLRNRRDIQLKETLRRRSPGASVNRKRFSRRIRRYLAAHTDLNRNLAGNILSSHDIHRRDQESDFRQSDILLNRELGGRRKGKKTLT